MSGGGFSWHHKNISVGGKNHKQDFLSSKRNVRIGKSSYTGVGTSFATDLINQLSGTCNNTLDVIGTKMLMSAVANAGFSDYTGVLINSYLYGVFINGHLHKDKCDYLSPSETRIGISDKTGSGSKRSNGPSPYIYIRNRRNLKSRDRMRFKENEFNPNGYGKEIATLSCYTSHIKSGSEIVLTNGAPYAEKVQMDNAGSNVMPTKSITSKYVSILRSELHDAIKDFNRGVKTSMPVRVGVYAHMSSSVAGKIVENHFRHCKKSNPKRLMPDNKIKKRKKR